MSSMPSARFATLNALSAIAWVMLAGAAGWLFGNAADRLFHGLGQLEV